VKHQLLDAEEVQIIIDSLYGDIDYQQAMTRKKFEEFNQDLFGITEKCVKEALDGARLTHGEIQEVVLVGGSTKIPKIQEMVRDSFKNSKIVNNINVDECVAIGAALEAAKIAKVTPENFTVSKSRHSHWELNLPIKLLPKLSIDSLRFQLQKLKFSTTERM
jgi:heat shock protein 1/8